MTEIEKLLFDGLDPTNASPPVGLGKLRHQDETLTLLIVSLDSKKELAILKFTSVAITSLWFDEQDTIEWPLDMIGFDSYADGERWRFVLNCSSIEVGWRSMWPTRRLPL